MNRGYLRYALGIIFLANFFSYLDRQVVATMEAQLKADLSMSQTEFGWVGSAFTIGYMVFAPIVGFLIARFPRPKVFAFCVLVWSLATVGSGFAGHKYILFATRFFIGVGEAGCLVIGPTLLSDYFPKAVRGRVLSIFFLALPLGGATGYIAGAKITEWLNWHWAFFLAGAPGFLIAVLIALLIDPAPSSDGPAPDPHAPPPVDPPVPSPALAGPADVKASAPPAPPPAPPRVEGLKPYLDLLKNKTLLFIILAQAFAVMFLQPFLHYGIGFFEEDRGMSKSSAAMTLAGIALVAGALGNALSGFVGDRLARRFRGAYALMAGVAFCVGMPFMLVGFSSTVIPIACVSLGLGAFCYFLCMPAVNTQIANSVPAEKRAMAYALAVFILHCLGDTAALPAFGHVATVLGSKHSAFLIFSAALLLAGGSCFLAARAAARSEAPPSQTS